MDDRPDESARPEEWVEALYARERAGEDMSLEESRALQRWSELQPDTRKWHDKSAARAALYNQLTGRTRRDAEAMTQLETRADELCRQLVGLSLEAATEIVQNQGFIVREVSHRNGMPAVTADFRSDRITLIGDRDDVVTRAMYG